MILEDDHEEFWTAYCEIPKSHATPETNEEAYDRYFSLLEIAGRKAPKTAARVRELWMEPNPFLPNKPPINSVQWAVEYLRLKSVEAGEGEETPARQKARSIKEQSKAQSKAAYEARLALYARRKATLKEGKDHLAAQVEARKVAQREFDNNWDAHLATIRKQIKDLEAIPADNWPY